ncbi:hypothetical protein BDV29DRAFT_189726 [Aspergillus leporis]|uniref:Uncharacterized protein n=1 Tax=Aspergillus leporis TaxID=41062 RepID=A0A5N5X9D1_9EURO|nr:hypothetical protein BDV29DRAFT_189726 [Aspergillus leporis]
MNESVPRSSDNEFDGSDFSNNLFSDLAPLLTLFGEQMGYGDDVLLAMAPLGIITCVISAIRVGGRKWLKALVGRARESRATAEMEIMSSTSDAVCELWSGAEIVRERGMPRTKEFIYLPVDAKAALAEWRASRIVYDLRTACEERLMQITKSTRKIPWRRQSDGTSLIDDRTRAVEYAKRLMQQAPNLTLNVTKAITSPIETWTFAVLGITIQLAVLVVASLVTYHWGLGQSGYSIVEYGFPLFLIGSVLLCGGIFICSYIIESVTEETDFELVENKKRTKVVRLQCACTVGDQHFGSYAIMNEEGNTTIRTSRINDSPDFSLLSVVATCLSLGGYILQFVGCKFRSRLFQIYIKIDMDES